MHGSIAKGYEIFTIHHMGEWLELHKRNNYQTILLLGSRAGALYRSLPLYDYCQQYTSHNLHTHSPIWSFRECYNVLSRQQLGERELHALLQDAFKHVGKLLGVYEGDGCFAEIVRKGYFREIISTNIDDLVERALLAVGLMEDRDFEVVIPGKLVQGTQTLSKERKLPYRLTKVFGDWLSRKYSIYNRQSFILDNEELNQYLCSILHGHVLAIGIDPLWDSGILPLLHDAPTTLWFVNGEEDIIYDQQVGPILDQAKSVAAVGKDFGYEEFWRSLYQQLCMGPMLKDRATPDWPLSSLKEEDLSQQGKKAIHISYIYCDDDLNLMQKFWRHLQVLRHNQLITEWHRGALTPGDHLQLEQERELRASQLIFVGFSPSFLSSEYYDQALQMLRLSHGGTIRLVPLLLRPVSNWKQTPFSMISPLPREGKTLSELSSKELDKELNKIANDIHELVKRLQKG